MSEVTWKWREPRLGMSVVFNHNGIWNAAIITNASASTYEGFRYVSGQSLVVFPAMSDSYVVEISEYGWSEGCWRWPDE